MKKYNSLLLITLVILVSTALWSCQKEEEDKTVTQQLVAKWQGETIHADVSVNGLKIDTLSQDLNIDTLLFEFTADGKYYLSSGNFSYTNKWTLERNDTQIKLEGFEDLFALMPDTLPKPETTIYIAEITETKLILEAQSEIRVQYQGLPVLIEIESLVSLHKLAR